MLEVVFVLRGRSVALEELKDARERAVLKAIERSLIDRVGSLRCPEHHASPRITASGSRADALEFDVAGCCQGLLDLTAACLA